MSLKEHLDISKEQKTSKDRYLCPFSMISTREIVTSILKFDPKIRPSYIIEERFILERIKENNKWINYDWTSLFWLNYVEELEQSLAEKMAQTELIFVWKEIPDLSPESYIEACRILFIQPWSSYAAWHKSYKKMLSTCHPDKVPQIVNKMLPSKPQDWSILEFHSQKNQIKERVKTLDLLKGEELDVVKSEIMEFIKNFIENIIFEVGLILEKIYPKKDEISKEEKIKINSELLMQNYWISFEEFYELFEERKRMKDIWDNLKIRMESDIWEKFAITRNNVEKAWEIFQCYQWVSWEQAKNIDIIWWVWEWNEGLYKKVDLDRNDAIVWAAFLRKRWSLWREKYWKKAYFPNGESLFAHIIRQIPEEKWPKDLINLIKFLESNKFEENKIVALATKLQESTFQKPECFDEIMESIIKYPWSFSESYEEYHFEPTLIFWKWHTWNYWLYEQDYEIPLWLLFSHLYLNIAWGIPIKIWEKFLKKYFKEISIHEIVEIIERMNKKENPEEIFSDKIEKLTKDMPSREAYELENEIFDIVDAIYNWLTVSKLDDFHFDTIEKPRAWVESLPNWWLDIYFPVNRNMGSPIYETLHFTEKEVKTMYLTALESNILDSHKSVMGSLWHNSEERN
ncbi:MAG: hypothetical protein ACD_49C00066G0003 [uncultured bacterium (gcode 4)]|uniref:Uncharacterized protein n=1 Tax=uncultured bacterium (gcode 4) TaxID=1234023 RepID=K2BV18_9BACT|nr:MAG: hypothetical protein ACD_49C00066G0003 [uncultured bacterium (gcode 4)]